MSRPATLPPGGGSPAARGIGARRLILIGATPPPAFGSTTLTPVLLDALDKRGLLAGHVETRDPRPLDRLARFDLENVRLGLLHAGRLARLLRAEPDAGVFVPISQGRWGFLRDALWIRIALLAQRRVYVHVNGGRMGEFYAGSAPPLRWVIRSTLARAEAVSVLTPSLRATVAGLVRPERLTLLPNAVPDQRRLAGTPRVRRGGFRVLFLSNLRERKGFRELLAAIALLGPESRGWTVRLVGAVPRSLRSELLAIASAQLDPGVTVEIPGPLYDRDKAIELAAADAFVLPTSYPNEGQPLALLEAMSSGLAIVATNYRGIPDTVADGSEAILLDNPDPGVLAATLQRLAADPEERRRLGRAARLRWERDFSPEPFGDRLAELLSR